MLVRIHQVRAGQLRMLSLVFIETDLFRYHINLI